MWVSCFGVGMVRVVLPRGSCAALPRRKGGNYCKTVIIYGEACRVPRPASCGVAPKSAASHPATQPAGGRPAAHCCLSWRQEAVNSSHAHYPTAPPRHRLHASVLVLPTKITAQMAHLIPTQWFPSTRQPYTAPAALLFPCSVPISLYTQPRTLPQPPRNPGQTPPAVGAVPRPMQTSLISAFSLHRPNHHARSYYLNHGPAALVDLGPDGHPTPALSFNRVAQAVSMPRVASPYRPVWSRPPPPPRRPAAICQRMPFVSTTPMTIHTACGAGRSPARRALPPRA